MAGRLDGSSVTIGATVPRTGAYAVQGEDELKGMQLAVEHINSGHELIKKIAPKITKGVLGKEVKLVVADSGAKPNQAVQEQQTFINDNKIVAMTGSTSSAVAVALNKFAQREKILYIGGDFRLQRHDRQGLRALLVPPVLLWRDGGERDRAGAGQGLWQGQEGGVHDAGLYLRPHRHQIGERLSDQERRLDQVTDQVSPLGTQDFSQYLTNIANSGAESSSTSTGAATRCCRSSRPSSSASRRR